MTENTITWRDIDGLTAEQTEQLTRGHAHNLLTEAELLDTARDYATANLLQAAMAGIPTPAGAVRTTIWFDDGEVTTREVYGKGWNVGNVNARITGTQDSAGAIVWRVEFDSVYGTVGDLTAVQVRELAEVLTEVTQELDRLNQDSPPFM
jgi:hypothetical protein